MAAEEEGWLMEGWLERGGGWRGDWRGVVDERVVGEGWWMKKWLMEEL